MKYGIYSIRDVKTGFLNITLDQSDATAIRNFDHACKNTESLFFTHSEDYSLYQIGEFETDSGIVTALDVPKFITDASILLRKELE